jgi:hypothetical protein
MALALWCQELGFLEAPESIDRRQRMARLALEDPIHYDELLEELRIQRAYMRALLERAGRDPSEALRKVTA